MAGESAPGFVARRRTIRWRQVLLSAAMFSVPVALLAILALPRDYSRTVDTLTRGMRGDSTAGIELAYGSAVLLVASQAYTVIKRIGVPSWIRKLGGAGLWLNLHIAISLATLVAGLLHSGYPYHFQYANLTRQGLGALTTWLLIAVTASGFFGRYVYRRLPAMKRLFAYWKPAHIAVTSAFLGVGVAHLLIA